MSFKLSKVEVKELAAHVSAVTSARHNVEIEFRLFLKLLSTLPNQVNAAIADYNRAAAAAEAFVHGIAEEHRDDYDDRSERWQESDRGQEALAFVEAWESVSINAIDDIVVLTPDAPEFDSADEIGALPEGAE